MRCHPIPFAPVLAVILAANPVSWGAFVSGRVLDPAGNPAPGARVFLEMGLGFNLVTATADRDGAFTFSQVRPSRAVGVFAYADGFGFGGTTLDVAISDEIAGVELRLTRPGTISGRVLNFEEKPVEGARISRVAIPSMLLSIPFAKLAEFGFTEPVSAADGRFSIPLLPEDSVAAIKVIHPAYAQAGVAGIAVGTRDARVALSQGVYVSGEVLMRGTNVPVANTNILIRKSSDPPDTVVTRSMGDGRFAVRLNPGAYHFSAVSESLQTNAGKNVQLTGESSQATVVLYVAGTGTIRGKVLDAKTGQPIDNARVILESNGIQADIRLTGPTGEYEFTATEGENAIRLASAPGYADPPRRTLTFTLAAGATIDAPAFFLAPVPEIIFEVQREDGRPVANAAVTILRPPQFGWRFTDTAGQVSLRFAQLPLDGIVTGLAESGSDRTGAFFALDTNTARSAAVKLLPLISVYGKVQSKTGTPLAGAAVDARFRSDELPETVVLWRTVSDSHGAFRWNYAIPHLPQYCTSALPGSTASGQSNAFISAGSSAVDAGTILLSSSSGGRSLLGERLEWDTLPILCGTLPDRKSLRSKPALIVYATSNETEFIAQALESLRDSLGIDMIFAVVSADAAPCPAAAIPILRGNTPATARTFLLDAHGIVVLETFGLPPVAALFEAAP